VCLLFTDGGRSSDDTQLGGPDITAAASPASPAAVHCDVRCTSDVGPAADVRHHPASRPRAVDEQWPGGVFSAWCQRSAGHCHDQQWSKADGGADSTRTQTRETQI